MKNKSLYLLCLASTFLACDKTPQACYETFNTQIHIDQTFSVFDACSRNRYTTVVDWGDETADTVTRNRKGATFSHKYEEASFYKVTLTVFNKKETQQDSEIFYVEVFD